MHEPLTDPLELFCPGVMTGPFQGKKGKHAGIPVPDPVSLGSQQFILNIKTPACGTQERSRTAVYAAKGRLFPKGRIKELVLSLLLELVRWDPGLYLSRGGRCQFSGLFQV